MVRPVRDRRFKYIRNYRPDLPCLGWIPYRNRHPIVQELWRLPLEGALDEAQSALFRYPRPVEELYDTAADPHEIHNLAADPRCRDELQRMRRALDGWLDEVGEMGGIPESEMVRSWYPDSRQPETAPVVCVPISPESPGIEPGPEGGDFRRPHAGSASLCHAGGLHRLYRGHWGLSAVGALHRADPSDAGKPRVAGARHPHRVPGKPGDPGAVRCEVMQGRAEVRYPVLLRLEATGLTELRWERFLAQDTRDLRDCRRD